MATLNERLFALFGEKAPIAPRSAADFHNLPQTVQMTMRQHMPDVVQSLLADPDQLPAAVALRREQKQLTLADIPALRTAGLTLEAEELTERVKRDQLSRFNEDFERFKAANDHPREHLDQYKRQQMEARIASKNF